MAPTGKSSPLFGEFKTVPWAAAPKTAFPSRQAVQRVVAQIINRTLLTIKNLPKIEVVFIASAHPNIPDQHRIVFVPMPGFD